MQPHETHGLEAHDGTKQGANQGDEGEEDSDTAGDNVGQDRDSKRAAEPCDPMFRGV